LRRGVSMDQATLNSAADDELLPSMSDKLLIIDDDRVHRMVIARIARQAGYAVDEAATYEAARRLMGEGEYACVTLDLSLGEHGGLEVLQNLAQIGFPAPVIVVSGSDDSVRQEALTVAERLGVNVCGAFGKPMNLSHLRILLSEIRKRQVVGLTPREA
jgi:two-component system, chemotaxis family, chemotaxis protein CheY